MLIKTCSPLCNGLCSPLKKKTFLSRLPNLSQNCLHPFSLSCLLLIELFFQIKRLCVYIYMYVCVYTYGSVILLVLVALKPRDKIITALCSDLTKSIRVPPSVRALWEGGELIKAQVQTPPKFWSHGYARRIKPTVKRFPSWISISALSAGSGWICM